MWGEHRENKRKRRGWLAGVRIWGCRQVSEALPQTVLVSDRNHVGFLALPFILRHLEPSEGNMFMGT